MGKSKKNKENQRALTPGVKFGTYLDFLKLLAWLNLPPVLFMSFIGFMEEYDSFTFIFTSVFVVFAFVTVICLILSYIKQFIKHFQEVVYYLISLESFILLVWFDFLGLVPFFDDLKEYTYIDILFLLVPLLLLFILAMIFFYFYHKNETVVKLNNHYHNGISSKATVSAPLIFGMIMLTRTFFQDNLSFTKILGIIVAVLLTATLPAGIMGGLFSAAYIRKYPDRKEL